MILSPDTTTSIKVAVSGTSAPFASTMGINDTWLFVSSTACWIKQGAGTPVASAATGSMYVPANVVLPITGKGGVNLAVIQDAAAGSASLTRALTY